MRASHTFKLSVLALSLALAAAACQQPAATNSNANTNAANSNAAATNSNTSSAAATTFETREPEQYQATLVITTATTDKAQAVNLPTMQIARSGANRRYAITGLPAAVGNVVFLDRADKRYLILEGRRQYVELSPETTGFDVRSLTPGQMAARLQQQPGVERVGEETVNGRSTIKYRYAGTARTGTQAGDVRAESFVYVDKDTGLPIKVESVGQATGSVQGASSGRVVAEMRDLTTTVDPALFELPQGYAQITQEQIRQQVQLIAGIFQAVMSAVGAGAPPPATGASPAATAASPAATASPTAH